MTVDFSGNPKSLELIINNKNMELIGKRATNHHWAIIGRFNLEIGGGLKRSTIICAFRTLPQYES